MTRSFVLMTAMPPTLGHLDLIKYAHALTHNVTVILNTQPGEPYVHERIDSIAEAVKGLPGVVLTGTHQELPQEPEGHEGFWDMWVGFLNGFGFRKGDYIVASEQYGKTLAEHAGGVFMPYDLDRTIRYTKASLVRNNPRGYFQDILPEFRKHLTRTVTFFGAESCGKTTATKVMAQKLNGLELFEWARPYLESVGPEVTVEKMDAIQKGQYALQMIGQRNTDHEFIFQDTDLFSTVGYWEMWHKDSMPKSILPQAHLYKSDLYVVMPSNIPFEADQLRYGGDKRESEDQYWIDLCEREGLNYIYPELPSNWDGRYNKLYDIIQKQFPPAPLRYQRVGKEYE